VLLRGVQPRRWLHVPRSVAFGLIFGADTVLAVQQDSTLTLGDVLIFRRQATYPLLGVSERRVFLEVSQTVYSLRLMIWCQAMPKC